MKTYNGTQLLDQCLEDQHSCEPLIWPGDTILVRSPSSFSGKIIRFGTGSYFNHAAIYLGKGLTLEADHRGLHVQHINWYIENRHDHIFKVFRPKYVDPCDHSKGLYTILNGESVVRHGLKWADKKPGYDFLATAGFVFRFIGMSIPFNPFNIKPRLFCSESVITVYRDAGISVLPGLDASLVSPGDLHRAPNMMEVAP